MILVTGGFGFIGSHTTRALLDAGEEVVVVQRRTLEAPPNLAGAPVVVERADAGDLSALLDIGRRHPITGIVHLAGSIPRPGSGDPITAAESALGSLFTVIRAAREWHVRRLTVASTIGVYLGVATGAPLAEDVPLSLQAPVWIPTFKKIGELLNGHLADSTDVEIVNLRISGTWGPLGGLDPFFAGPALVHAAARGAALDLSGQVAPAFAEDALDLNYVKDTGRAIALLQLADRLRHRTYNVGSGRATSNAQIAAAIREVVPGADVDLPTGGTAPALVLDIDRLTTETGYRPQYDTASAVRDYLEWLRRGHAR